jgi:DNA invertase Pin-like site-specific DNA recombinase
MIGLYVRTSSVGQNEDRQISNLTSLVGDQPHRLYSDKGISGTIEFSERPQGQKLLKDVEDGLVTEVWFHEVSRCGRDTRDIINTLHGFVDQGVQVRVQKEGLVLLDEDKGRLNPVSGLILSVLSSVSEMENEQRRERQFEGIELRKLRGGYTGRVRGSVDSNEKFLNKSKNQKILGLLKKGHNLSHVSSIVGCSRPLVRKVREIFREEYGELVEMTT